MSRGGSSSKRLYWQRGSSELATQHADDGRMVDGASVRTFRNSHDGQGSSSRSKSTKKQSRQLGVRPPGGRSRGMISSVCSFPFCQLTLVFPNSIQAQQSDTAPSIPPAFGRFIAG